MAYTPYVREINCRYLICFLLKISCQLFQQPPTWHPVLLSLSSSIRILSYLFRMQIGLCKAILFGILYSKLSQNIKGPSRPVLYFHQPLLILSHEGHSRTLFFPTTLLLHTLFLLSGRNVSLSAPSFLILPHLLLQIFSWISSTASLWLDFGPYDTGLLRCIFVT